MDTCDVNNSDKHIVLVYGHVGPVTTGHTFDEGFRVGGARVKPDGDLWSLTYRTENSIDHPSDEMTRPTIVFLDATGLMWERVDNGEPRRVHDLTEYVRARTAERQMYWRERDQGGSELFATVSEPGLSQPDPA